MSNKVRLFFAGDFCSKPSTSLISVSDELRNLIQSCDLKVVNFEVPLKPDFSLPKINYERFYQNDDAPAFLKNLGFNLFPLANNHAFDWGEEGYKKTKAAFGDNAFGAGIYDEAYRVKDIETNDVKIGFLALTFASRFGVFHDVTRQTGYGCAFINDLKVNHLIIEAKKEVDYLIILPHDGLEFIDVPMPETIARYRDFIDYGADAVIGSHPHCPQGWEEYKGKPIFYSLGNFFFNSKEDSSYRAWNRPHWYEGMCVVLEIMNNQMQYIVYNTRNKDNVALSLDVEHEKERDKHNEKLCSYLKKEDLYMQYLNSAISKSASYDLNVLDASVYNAGIKTYMKTIAKRWRSCLKGIKKQNDPLIGEFLKNDSRRNAVLRYLNSQKNE